MSRIVLELTKDNSIDLFLEDFSWEQSILLADAYALFMYTCVPHDLHNKLLQALESLDENSLLYQMTCKNLSDFITLGKLDKPLVQPRKALELARDG